MFVPLESCFNSFAAEKEAQISDLINPGSSTGTSLGSWSSIWHIESTLLGDKLCPSSTEPQNLTRVPEFLLLGLSDDREWQPVLFGLFLYMYLVTVLGNLLIILAVGSDPHLHTPILLLGVMAYDRLVAICHPLHYTAIMNPRLCGLLVSASVFTSLLVSQMHNSII
ncbi:Olfactory Receptor 7E24 [Manis pentadactyla]|nr:Olfactory Receptor 7E24 [Manis pentadactyla]